MTKTQNIIGTVIALGFACLLAPIVYAETLEVGGIAITYDQSFETDFDGNGTSDRTSYYAGDTLVFTAFDLDENGKPELWLRYKGGDTVDLELADTTGDGEPDSEVTVFPNEKVEVVYDESGEASDDAAWKNWLFVGLLATLIAIMLKKRFGKAAGGATKT